MTTTTTKEQKEVSLEDYKKVQKLRSYAKMGVSAEAVEARCRTEGIEPRWILEPDTFKIVLDDSYSINNNNNNDTSNESAESFFRLNDDGDVEFPKDPNKNRRSMSGHLTLLVQKLVATVKRIGRLPTPAGGGGPCIAVSLRDLQNALNSFRAVAYARDLYGSTTTSTADNDTAADLLSPDEVRCKQKAFLEHVTSLGLRPPGKSDDVHQVVPGLDGLIAFLEKTMINCPDRSSFDPKDATPGTMYTFEDLADLFRPGERVIARNAFSTGVNVLCQVAWSRYEEGKTLGGIVRRFVVNFEFVTAVGEDAFVIANFCETLREFEENKQRPIDSLPFLPLSVLAEDEQQSQLEHFRRRGEKYEKIAIGAHFMKYTKGSFYPKAAAAAGAAAASPSALRGDGRVMVDLAGSYDAGFGTSIGYDGMVDAIRERVKEYNVYQRQKRQTSASSATIDRATRSPTPSDDGLLLLKTIPKYLLELTWPALTGFSFTSKAWGDVLLDGLFEINFQEAIFDQLVLPAARKRMIRALVRHSNDSFHDIVSGKGEGSVFLLYGPPGCGKTLTAEAISEMLHRPLYSVSLGQLGTTPAELETKLGAILDLCSRWDALILLDEADTFLEKRSRDGSLERNAMVSVMLRLVEYFKGVLFLTSNRVDALDPAFKTRITLALRYEQLGMDARYQVWSNILDASGQGQLVREGSIDLATLAAYELNGREVKNCIRLALALAAEDEEPLSQGMLLETVDLLCDFNQKLESADAY